jgi:DNA-binding response OmpR family regulator
VSKYGAHMGSLRLPRILLLDEEPSLSSAICICIDCCGYEARAVHSEGAALRLVSRWRPNLVIASFRMRKVAVAEFCRRLRRITPIPIIFLCATNEERAQAKLLKIRTCDFLMKPFSIDQLLGCLIKNSSTRQKFSASTPHSSARAKSSNRRAQHAGSIS